MNIFFDFDGTLINSQNRLFALFQFLVPTSNLSFDEYWILKRNKVNHKEILTQQFNYSIEDYLKFEHLWMTEIENQKWLEFDKPFEGVTELLNQLKADHNIYLVTARQSKLMVDKQLTDFGWNNLFDGVFVTEQKQDKHTLIKENVAVNSNDWLIGDTGMDIEVGKILGINTAAVLSGFLSREKLEEYQPDVVIPTVTAFKPNF